MPPNMSATTTRPSLKPSHSHRSSHSKSSKSSTTPLAHPPARTPASVGQSRPPLLTPNPKSPAAPAPSPNYFGFIVESSNPPGSNPGEHARRNWDLPTSQTRTNSATPRATAVEANPEYDAFRRKSETRPPFNLSHGSLSSFSSRARPDKPRASPLTLKRPSRSPLSPTERRSSPPSVKKDDGMEVDSDDSATKSFFDIPRIESPSSVSSGLAVPEIPHHRHSIPPNHPSSSSSSESLRLMRPGRSETLPASGVGAPSLLTPDEAAILITAHDVLLLDLRVFPQYSTSCIRGALNLCIPTTLLKRPSFNLQKLQDTFTNEEDQQKFAQWRHYNHILVYDANSNAIKEAIAPMHVLNKFINEGWNGHAHIIKGGFLEFSRAHSDLISQATAAEDKGGAGKQMLSLSSAPDVAPVAGGCPMPNQSAANPFFGNIRQNMDLIGGVGQMAIKHPGNMNAKSEETLPSWLRNATASTNNGKEVSEKFLSIEQTEQKRMQEALSGTVQYGTPGPQEKEKFQIAGIEKGSKNRYNNIFPYDHSRVKLKDVSSGDCDYVNANHVKASFSNKRYVATQAPIPATFADFWRVVWDQDVRVIVMLTAEAEGGQVKSHPYWHTGEYGQMKIKALSEKKIPLHDTPSSTPVPKSRPGIGQRRSTNPHTALEKSQAVEDTSSPSDPPSIFVRHLTLSHAGFPFRPMREITQIQYTSWPDFGAPADPKDLLSLLRHTDKSVQNTSSSIQSVDPDQPAPPNQRPVIVHCSAGCGRTGTFCTVDSVIDVLKRQRANRFQSNMDSAASSKSSSQMDIDDDLDSWVKQDDVDLVERAVEDFRSQRLSMVQSLRQFVLCYESVLQWVVSEDEKDRAKRTEKSLKDRKGLLGHGPRHSLGG